MVPDTFYFVIMDDAVAHIAAALAPFWQVHRDRL